MAHLSVHPAGVALEELKLGDGKIAYALRFTESETTCYIHLYDNIAGNIVQALRPILEPVNEPV